MKSAPKQPPAPDTEQPTVGLLDTVIRTIQEKSFSYFCLVSTAITLAVTVVYLMNWLKREKNLMHPSLISEKAQQTDGGGDKNEDEDEKDPIDRDGVESEIPDPDTSETQEGSEEDLPWILQKAPSQTTLSDDKENLLNEEKQSDDTESEKSQDFARISKSAAGDLLDGPIQKAEAKATAIEEEN